MEKTTVKLLSALMAMIMIICSAVPAFADELSGIKSKTPSDKNKTITYRIDKQSKTLYIDGTGEIPDYYMGFTKEEVDDSWELRNNSDFDGNDKIYNKEILPAYYIEINTSGVNNLVIGEGITSIGERAFAYALPCIIGNISYPSTLKSIGGNAFDGVPAVTSSAYKYKNKTTSCTNKSVKYSFDKNNYRVTISGKGAIPNNYLGWTKNDYNAMSNAVKRAMTVPDEPNEKDIFVWKDGKYINGYGVTYEDCYKMSFPQYYLDVNFYGNKAYILTINNGITSIGDNAFAYCYNYVNEIHLPSTLKNIGKNAFAGTTADRIVIPSSVKTLAGDAFTGKTVNCDGKDYTYQTEIIISGKNTEIKGKIYQSYVVPKGSKAESALKKAKCKYKTITSPKAVKAKKVTAKSKGLKVNFNKTSYSGYQIQVATDKKFTKNKKSFYLDNTGKKKPTSKTISKLKGNKKYYVRIRAYKTYKNVKFYGAWSKVTSVKTKK